MANEKDFNFISQQRNTKSSYCAIPPNSENENHRQYQLLTRIWDNWNSHMPGKSLKLAKPLWKTIQQYLLKLVLNVKILGPAIPSLGI